MCQKAPNCTDFSKISRGSMPPDLPTRACHVQCSRSCILCYIQNSHTNSQTRFFFFEARTVSEVSTALKTIKSHLRFFFFIVFRQATFNKKKQKKNLNKSKILKAKMGPRMHRIAPFFQKISGGACPRTPLAWLCAFCARMNILYVSNIAPPLSWNPGSAPDLNEMVLLSTQNT